MGEYEMEALLNNKLSSFKNYSSSYWTYIDSHHPFRALKLSGKQHPAMEKGGYHLEWYCVD